MIKIFSSLAFQCANVAVPEPSEQAMRYYHTDNVLWVISLVLSFLIPFLFLATGFSGTLSKLAKKWGRNWYFTIVVFLLFYLSLSQILTLPLDYYTSYVFEHDYGLSNQTLGRWFSNYGKSFLVSLITAFLFIWIFYLLLKKSPRRWWIYSSLVSVAILFIMMLVQPIWIDPLFNRFGPMKNKELEAEILHLASRAGIEDGRIFEVDKSQDTKTVNAYVVGFGSTNRIVLWDTIIQQLTPEQLLFVMGHEMGHYILHHIWWQLVYFTLLSFALFYCTYRFATYLMKRYHARFGFSDLSNIASLPLLLLLIGLFLFLTTPLSNFVSRTMEHQADRFGLEITQNNEAAAEAFVVLQQKNLANPRPGPIYNFWRNTHPSLGSRIDFCNSYCPWQEGQSLHYSKHFKE